MSSDFTREEFDLRPMRKISEERRDFVQRTTYSEYGACPKCRALPGNPCRERAMWGGNERLDRPHPVRPPREATDEPV